MKPRRFCMLTTFYPPYHFGGDAVYVQRLVHALAERGHHVEVVHCVDSYRLLGGDAVDPPPDPPNVVVHRLHSPFGPLSPLATQQTGYPLFKRRAIQAVLAQGFDVIHYHNLSLVGGPQALRYGQAVKLYTPNEYWLVCPTHVLFKHNATACEKPDCLRCQLSHRRPPQWWRYTGMLDRATRHVDLFLLPSQFGIDIHRARGLDRPMAHLPSFLPEPQGAADPPSIATAAPYFLFVGRLEKLKGLQTVLPVFRRLPQARLLVAGSGSYEAELRRQAADLPNVVFLGARPYGELQALYRHALALVVPSICYEVFPLVMLEAFAQGAPVVARRLGSQPEVVAASGGGLLFETEGELTAALTRLLTDETERRALGERGRAAYRARWTADAHIRRYLEVIDELEAQHACRNAVR